MADYPDASDYSTFVAGNAALTGDLDPNWTPIGGLRAVLEHVARRLLTSPGTMHDDEYGYNLRAAYNAGLRAGDLRRIAAGVEGEALKVEGVEGAEATATLAPDGTLTVQVSATLADDETYPLVFVLSQDGIKLLPLLGG